MLAGGGSESLRSRHAARDTYETVQLVKHGDTIDVGSCLHGYARLESVVFGIRHHNRTSSF